MSWATLLVFPVTKKESKSGKELAFPKINLRQIKDHTFSLSDNAKTLEQKLWEKVIEERVNLYHLATQCKKKDDLYRIRRWTGKDDFTYEDYRYLDQEPLCSTFMEKIAAGYQDIFERDLEAFDQVDFNVDVYAVVLLKRGEYFGHVYAWMSPTNPDLVFCIGIRARVDWIFYKTKYADSALTSIPISSLLFEGIRRFASIKGARSMIIYQPLQVIKNIALRIGFELLPEDMYDPEDIGESIFNYEYLIRPFEDSLVRNTEEPIVREVGEFVLKEWDS